MPSFFPPDQMSALAIAPTTIPLQITRHPNNAQVSVEAGQNQVQQLSVGDNEWRHVRSDPTARITRISSCRHQEEEN